jgi:23S rRNA (uracil1939-C5)-methyltransferase
VTGRGGTAWRQGLLRYAVIREGKNTGERLLNIVAAPGEIPGEDLLNDLGIAGLRVDTLVSTVNAGLSDTARGETARVFKGSGAITETLKGLPFRISPGAFFQTNTRGAEILYDVIAQGVGDGIHTLLDFYCGAGSIGLYCADRIDRLVGVELSASAVEDARHNARLQGRTSAEFHAMDAARFRERDDLLSLWSAPGTGVVMDPPRPGLGKDVRRLLIERPVARWTYVSCNPRALAEDLPYLRSVYEILDVRPVDLFPHTPHVETVLLLRRR